MLSATSISLVTMMSFMSRAIDGMTGFDSYSRAWVMAKRPDCPVDLNGLSSIERAWVMVNRRDCPIDLTGLDPKDIAWVTAKRPDFSPATPMQR